jgi:hypothetical protein
MDGYGTCQIEDAPMIVGELRKGLNVTFSIGDGVSAYILFITPKVSKIGNLPFGGSIFSRYLVGVLYRGFDYFDLVQDRQYPSYVAEKLSLCSPDAEFVCEFLNALHEELRPK